MIITAEILHRIQFAFTLTFHYIYPPMSIGLSLALIFMEGMYLATKNVIWEQLTKFWVKVFAMTFALGVATGIPLPFSMGTNWARYSRFVGDIFGSLLGAEGFFAFLVEAGFLGILLFGWKRVSSKMHFFATIMVAFGAHFSGLWIVAANSWMQTPAGYRLATSSDGVQVAEVANWWQMFLNDSTLTHVTHVLLGAWMTGAFMLMSVSAFYLLKKRHHDFSKKGMKLGVLMGLGACLLQLISGDNLARNVSVYNPEKFASLEGVYETKPYTPLYVWGWVDSQNKTVHGLPIPGGLSFITYGDFKKPIKGLDQFPKNHWPWVPVVFQMYHIMVIFWGLMVLAALGGTYIWWKKKWSAAPRWMLRFISLAVIFPQISNIAGWYTSCMGRQPWVVYKLLKTSEGYSATIAPSQVWVSLTMFVFIYLLFFVLFLILYDQKIKHGPITEEEALPYRDIFEMEKEEKKNG